jgi:hypothetical protein
MWLCVYYLQSLDFYVDLYVYLGVDQFDELGIFSSVIQSGEASLGGLLPTKFAANFYVDLCFLFPEVRFLCGCVSYLQR